MRNRFFGPHLVIDLQDCDNSLLANEKLIYSTLRDIPEKIGMTRISEPNVFYYTGRIPEDHGVTGVVVLAESHCSIHTFQEKGYCFVDLFSCKSFDTFEAVKLFTEIFKANKYEYKIIQRGENYPR